MESAKKMREIQPLVDKLKKKYKNDQKGLMAAQTELYKQKGVNPAAGCLPIIPQMIILGIFASVLSMQNLNIEKINTILYSPIKFVEGSTFNTHLITIGKYTIDLAKPDILPVSGLPFKVPGALLIIGAIAQFVSVKVMSPLITAEKKVAEKTKTEVDDTQLAVQSSMTYMFPIMTLWVGTSFSAGLALYFLISSLFNTIRQIRIQGWGGLTPLIRKLGLVQ